MKEMVAILWCDGEHEEPEHAIAEHRISLDGAAPRLVDLCEGHGKLIDDLQPLMAKGIAVDGSKSRPKSRGGRRVGGGTPGQGRDGAIVRGLEHECPVCEHTVASEQGLQKHMRRVHDTSLGQVRREQRQAESDQMSLDQ